jgi:ssDNA-binding Zn-finger/Zn-ribbon topoisomerase 1
MATLKRFQAENPILFNALAFHRTHKGEFLDFKNYPYLRGIYADASRNLGVMKATQCGASEYAVVRDFALAMSGFNVFHVLPTDRILTRYVKERFDKSLSSTPEYNSQIRANSVTMKQIGEGAISFVGSNSTANFTEFPADDAIIDENDQCNQGNIKMVEDRLANSKRRSTYIVGNPTITDFGIHAKFKNSKQFVWHVKCPKCGDWFHPEFLKHAVERLDENVWTYRDRAWQPSDARDPLMLHDCGEPIDRKREGVWIARNPAAESAYYHIGKEFSTQISMRELCAAFSRGLDSEAEMQRFYNSDLGLPYTQKGSFISTDELNAAVGEHPRVSSCASPCVCGVDVGASLHTVVNQILPDGGERAVFIGELKSVEDVKQLCMRFNIISGVIDAMPEIRMAREVSAFKKWCRCEFHSAKSFDRIEIRHIADGKKVWVNRTEILDATAAKIRERRLLLPRDAASLPDFYKHVTALTRVFNSARQEYEWVGERADHYLFALAYAVVARRVTGVLI